MPSTKFTRLIKAANLLENRTIIQFAAAAKLSPGRASDVASGRALPTFEELHRVMVVLGLNAVVPITIHPNQKGTQGTQGTQGTRALRVQQLLDRISTLGISPLLLLLAGKTATDTAPTNVSNCHLTIDKLSFTFNVNDEGAFANLAESIGAQDHGYGRQSRSKYKSRYQDSTSSLRLEHTPSRRDVRFGRCVFNPNRLFATPSMAIDNLRRVIELADVETIHVTRIDIAVDLPVPRNAVHILNYRRQKFTVIGNAFTGIESEYAGPSNGNQICVYDKSLKHKTPGPETRIEARLRPTRTLLGALSQFSNPFANVELFRRPAEATLHEELLGACVDAFGIDLVRASLTRKDAKLLQGLTQKAAPLSFPHPSDVFEAQWQTVSSELLLHLGVGESS